MVDIRLRTTSSMRASAIRQPTGSNLTSLQLAQTEDNVLIIYSTRRIVAEQRQYFVSISLRNTY